MSQGEESVEQPDQYLHIRDCRSGEEWIRPLRGNAVMCLTTQVRKWVVEHFCREAVLDGKLQRGIDGDYFARLIISGRPLDTVVVWESGGFYLKAHRSML